MPAEGPIDPHIRAAVTGRRNARVCDRTFFVPTPVHLPFPSAHPFRLARFHELERPMARRAKSRLRNLRPNSERERTSWHSSRPRQVSEGRGRTRGWRLATGVGQRLEATVGGRVEANSLSHSHWRRERERRDEERRAAVGQASNAVARGKPCSRASAHVAHTLWRCAFSMPPARTAPNLPDVPRAPCESLHCGVRHPPPAFARRLP